MRKLRPLLILLLAVPVLAACSDVFDLNINKDPNAATSVKGDYLMPTVLTTMAENKSIEFGPDMQFFTQIWASNGSAGVFTEPENYSQISPYTTGNTWGQMYTTVLKNLKLMKDQALAADPQQVNTAAQAMILSAYTFWINTMLWEQVPYTEALDGVDFPHPHFDDQQTILTGLVAKLDSAVALANANGPAGVTDGDLMYGGDMDLWVRFANSLKLRVLMELKSGGDAVDAQITAVLSQPLIRANDQEADIPFFNTTGNENNVWKLNNMFGGFIDVGNGNGFLFAGKSLVDQMQNVSDPRISTYFELPTDLCGAGNTPATTYIGQEAGVFDYCGAQIATVSQNIIRRDWPGRILSASEVWFNDAEFKASNGDLSGAFAAYQSGVQVGLDYFDGKPGAISTADKTAYMSSLGTGFADQATALDAIHAQQYIEVFDRAPENWALWRRTHYPDLPLPQNATLGNIIRRFPYPPNELSANPNAPTNSNGPGLDVPMWYEGN